jgi:hypothetical protein
MELNEFKAARVPQTLQQFLIGIHHDGDTPHPAHQVANPRERLRWLDEAFGSFVKIKAQGIRSGGDAHAGIGFICDTAYFDADAPRIKETHLIVRASAFLMEGWWVIA